MKTTHIVLLLIALSSALAACGPSSGQVPTQVSPTRAAETAVAQKATPSNKPLTEVTVVMGYVPNVQFAPFYVAEKKGFFAEQGLKVKFNWGFEVDGIKLVGANQAEFALLGGDQVIQARSQKIPLVYVANYYNAFPISIFSLKEKNIKTPQDLVGKRVALSGYFGATYNGWRALLYSTGIKESDVTTQDVAFAQIAALTQGLADAAAGYSNNEPVQLRLQGKEINVINVGDYSRLVGIGLVTSEKIVAEKPELARAMVIALVRGIEATRGNLDEALTICVQAAPELGGQNIRTSQAVLAATNELWKAPRIGFVDPADWLASARFMKDAGFIKEDVDVSKAYTNKFVP
ncbi:MAG: ABC transporter substrate-binding protein [Chloroflexi bacterium]|nr:ABC transporter substrate-binding protein [Chloroflexota bacterium]